MGSVYLIRSGRDDPRGCYAGSGESLAAWTGGIYRSCAGAECRLLAHSRRSPAAEFRPAYWRIADLRGSCRLILSPPTVPTLLAPLVSPTTSTRCRLGAPERPPK